MIACFKISVRAWNFIFRTTIVNKIIYKYSNQFMNKWNFFVDIFTSYIFSKFKFIHTYRVRMCVFFCFCFFYLSSSIQIFKNTYVLKDEKGIAKYFSLSFLHLRSTVFHIYSVQNQSELSPKDSFIEKHTYKLNSCNELQNDLMLKYSATVLIHYDTESIIFLLNQVQNWQK